jgi:adenylate cyclase
MALPRVRLTPGAVAGCTGATVLALLLAVWLLAPDWVREPLRERSLDVLLPVVARPTAASRGPEVTPKVMIIDIDRASLSRFGPWPWPRALLARLAAAVALGGPKAVGVDILTAGPDRLSPAALARALGAATGNAEITGMASQLPDADVALAEAFKAVPTALGFALDPEAPGIELPAPPVLLRGTVRLPAIWQAPGVIGPNEVIAAGAQGFGALALAADQDGLVRRVPLLVFAQGMPRPGLAAETLRVSQDAGELIIGPGPNLYVGETTAPLGPDAALRLVPRPATWWQEHRLSAADLLDDPATARELTGRIVLIGGSAPELGGLRETPASPVTPSVLIQATAIDTLLHGPLLRRPAEITPVESGGALLVGCLGIVLASLLRPVLAGGLTSVACVSWFAGAVWAAHATGLLVDPVGPPVIAACAFAAATIARSIREEQYARWLRMSFEQHLAPEVVRRISTDPAAIRLQGETREITAFFTDIESFTAMTERAAPADLVALLDAYFDMAGRVVTTHGGMVEKIVGDAVHAIFNAPFSLENHAARAVQCAVELLRESEIVRASPLGQKLQLGRTRVGIETGTAIVGDIGGSRKLDYTAHGNVMNTAARLEALNKELGSSVCIGPGTAAQLPVASLRRIGTVTPRGQTVPLEVFTPAELP